MKTEIEIQEEIDRLEKLLEVKRQAREWRDYEYYEERIWALDWVLNA